MLLELTPAPCPLPDSALSQSGSEVIDCDLLPDVSVVDDIISTSRQKKSIQTKQCTGYILRFPPGKTAWSLYPFKLHDTEPLAWTIGMVAANGEIMTLFSASCTGKATCMYCSDLEDNTRLKGIVNRIKNGIKEGTNLAYYGIDGLIEIVHRKTRQIDTLRLGKLNVARSLASKSATIEDWKRLYLALASGKVRNCERLLSVAVNQKRGVRGALQLYTDAVVKHYKPRNTDEESVLIAIVLWRLGGTRVANFAHRALNLPGLSTLRRYSTMQPIIASYRFPSMSDVEKNLHSILSDDLLATLKTLSANPIQLI
jgi:hypothetical protein